MTLVRKFLLLSVLFSALFLGGQNANAGFFSCFKPNTPVEIIEDLEAGEVLQNAQPGAPHICSWLWKQTKENAPRFITYYVANLMIPPFIIPLVEDFDTSSYLQGNAELVTRGIVGLCTLAHGIYKYCQYGITQGKIDEINEQDQVNDDDLPPPLQPLLPQVNAQPGNDDAAAPIVPQQPANPTVNEQHSPQVPPAPAPLQPQPHPTNQNAAQEIPSAEEEPRHDEQPLYQADYDGGDDDNQVEDPILTPSNDESFDGMNIDMDSSREEDLEPRQSRKRKAPGDDPYSILRLADEHGIHKTKRRSVLLPNGMELRQKNTAKKRKNL